MEAPHEQALKAHVLFHLDRDYVVKDDEVIIVDEFTGRLMRAGGGPMVCTSGGSERGREDPTRESDACDDHIPELLPHVQEARRYDRTADTEAASSTRFTSSKSRHSTNASCSARNSRTSCTAPRRENPQRRGRNQGEEAKASRSVGTISVEKSSGSRHLKEDRRSARGVEREEHEREAHIVAQAVQGTVTVSTNMAAANRHSFGGNPEFITRKSSASSRRIRIFT